MEKNKEDAMTDLEIIKHNVEVINVDPDCNTHHNKQTDKIIAAATRMAAEIERLKNEVNETQVVYYSVLKENKQLKDALAEKPDIVRCGECKYFKITKCVDDPAHGPTIKSCEYYAILDNDGQRLCPCREPNQFCSEATRKEAKDED